MAERYAYYPGCTLTHSAAAYDVSARAVAATLGMDLVEIDDWNCCGATEYMALNRQAAYALVARNLALAEEQFTRAGNGTTAQPPPLLAACSACFLNLSKVDHAMRQYPQIDRQTNEALAAGNLRYNAGSLVIRHLVDAIVNSVGLDRIKAKVTRPLHGLRVAPYYGCLITRPSIPGHTFDDPEYPTYLDDLMAALGAEVVDFPLKTHCCGGHMTQISAETAYELIYRLLRNAAEYDADLIVTLCPMCQLNLDAYQGQVNRHFGANFKLPVLYFTQMMGLAFGLRPKELGLGQEIVSAAAALKKIGAEVAAAAEGPARRRKDDKRLPMSKKPTGRRGGEQ